MVDPLFDENYNLWVMFLQTRDVAWAARTKDLAKYNLAATEAAVLNFVQLIERTVDRQATIAEISRWLFRKPNSMSELLSRMEKKGLVRKIHDLDRKNLVRVEMTEKGRQAYMYAARLTSIHRIMSSLSEDEHHRLSLLLGKLCEKASEELGIDNKQLKKTLPPGY